MTFFYLKQLCDINEENVSTEIKKWINLVKRFSLTISIFRICKLTNPFTKWEFKRELLAFIFLLFLSSGTHSLLFFCKCLKFSNTGNLPAADGTQANCIEYGFSINTLEFYKELNLIGQRRVWGRHLSYATLK